jgi:hypothetical protein
MLPDLNRDADGDITLYIQHEYPASFSFSGGWMND